MIVNTSPAEPYPTDQRRKHAWLPTAARSREPAGLPAPSGYSHGTLSGNTLYLGGQTALDADADRAGRHRGAVPAGVHNVLTTLREAGGMPADLVSITIYLTDIPDYQAHGKEIGRVWRELAGPVYPAMAGIGCTALWQPEA